MQRLAVLLVLSVMLACSPYKWTDKKNLYVLEAYPSDTIVLQDFVFCSVFRKEFKTSFHQKRDLPYDEQTILNTIEERFFLNSLKYDPKKLQVLEGQNRCDTIFRSLLAFRMNDEIQQAIIEISKNNQAKTQLIPYIFFGERFGLRHTLIPNFFDSGGMTDRTMKVAMIIVENNEIVYIKTDQHFGKSHFAERREEAVPILDFSILQDLIASTLKDYFERIK